MPNDVVIYSKFYVTLLKNKSVVLIVWWTRSKGFAISFTKGQIKPTDFEIGQYRRTSGWLSVWYCFRTVETIFLVRSCWVAKVSRQTVSPLENQLWVVDTDQQLLTTSCTWMTLCHYNVKAVGSFGIDYQKPKPDFTTRFLNRQIFSEHRYDRMPKSTDFWPRFIIGSRFIFVLEQ